MNDTSKTLDWKIKQLSKLAGVKNPCAKWDIPKVFPWQGIGVIPETTPLKDAGVSKDVFFLVRDYVFARQGGTGVDVEMSTCPPLAFELGRLVEGYWRFFDEQERLLLLDIVEGLNVNLAGQSDGCYRPEFCLISILNCGFEWVVKSGLGKIFDKSDAFLDLEELLDISEKTSKGIDFTSEFCGSGKFPEISWNQFKGPSMSAVSTPCVDSYIDLSRIASQVKLDKVAFRNSCVQMMSELV